MMAHWGRKRVSIFLACVILASIVSILLPIGRCTGPSAGEVWAVETGDSYPISITINVETAGNGSKSVRQTGTLRVVTTTGTGVIYSECASCGGQGLVLNRSTLVPEWDTAWFMLYDDYNPSDEVNSEINCLCHTNNTILAKVLTTTNWQDIENLLQAKSDALEAEAIAMGAVDYLGTVSGTDPMYELSYSYSNGTSDTGVARNGKITYKGGILSKLVFNEERKGDPSGLPPNTIVIRSEKWTMGDQGVAIPGMSLFAFIIANLVGIILIMRKKSGR